MNESLWLVGDFSRELPLSGVTISNKLSLGFRHELSDTSAFLVSFVIDPEFTEPGFRFHLSVGGKKERVIAPQTPETGEELLF